MKLLKPLKLLSIIIIFVCNVAYAEVVIVKDGDTIKIGSRNIRLFGIDAPELKQKCYYLNDESWDCGRQAAKFLQELIGEQMPSCEAKSIDLYKREVAICYIGNQELNKIMVEKGFAIAYKQYSKKYVSDENNARKSFAGIWNSSFMEPSQWRRYIKFQAKAVE